MTDLNGKVALVTGASGDRGRGRAIARARGGAARARLAQRGKRGIDGRRRGALRCARRRGHGGVRRPGRRAVRRLDILVANGGVGRTAHSSSSTRAPAGDDRRQREGHDLRGPGRAAAPVDERRGRHRGPVAFRGRAPRSPLRGLCSAHRSSPQVGLTRASIRAPPQGRRCTNVWPGGVGDGVRDGSGPHPGHARAPPG